MCVYIYIYIIKGAKIQVPKLGQDAEAMLFAGEEVTWMITGDGGIMFDATSWVVSWGYHEVQINVLANSKCMVLDGG